MLPYVTLNPSKEGNSSAAAKILCDTHLAVMACLLENLLQFTCSAPESIGPFVTGCLSNITIWMQGPGSSDSASSECGDNCEGADDESSETDDEETASDKEMLDDCPLPVDSAQNHRLADQEREMGASAMVS